MRVHPMPVEKAPLYLHFTYSLCLHAAALSLLITIPVLGGSGTLPGGEYTVSLTSHEDQASSGDTIEMTDRQPEGEPGAGRPADIGAAKKDTATVKANDAGKNNIPEENQLADADAAKMTAASNSVTDSPNPGPIPSSIAAPPTGGMKPTSTEKPFSAEVPSEPLPDNADRSAIKKNDLREVRTGPSAQTKTAAAVKSTTPAPLIQEPPPVKPDVPEVLPDPEPESAAVMPPMFIPAKTTVPETDNKLSPSERIQPFAERKIAPSKTTAKAREKGDSNSSPGEIGTSPETRGKNLVGRSHPAVMPAGIASVKKDGQSGNMNYETGGPTSGGESSPKNGGAAGPGKSGGLPGAGRYGDGGTGNAAGTTAGSGQGYKFSAASPLRKFGLLHGIGDASGEPTLARGEHPSGKAMSEKEKNNRTEEVAPVAIRIPEELLERDIKIEVAADEKTLSDISMGLTIRAHPANRKKHVADAERKIEAAEITIGKENPAASATKTLTLKKAEKGVYIFSLTNAGSASSVAVVFRLYARSRNERIKEYKSLPLTPATTAKFRFLMPEAVFWDDTDRFSGSIEDAYSVTKFRYETGLLWKEEKER